MGLDVDALVREAIAAREHSYSPYSRFAVGAALLTASGQVFRGCNVENASYGLTICAERVAIVGAVAAGHRDFVALAVVTDTVGPASPCGLCRQTMVEFSPRMQVILANLRGELLLTSPLELLPGAFTPADLSAARKDASEPGGEAGN